jgi:hypothetical protein
MMATGAARRGADLFCNSRYSLEPPVDALQSGFCRR